MGQSDIQPFSESELVLYLKGKCTHLALGQQVIFKVTSY